MVLQEKAGPATGPAPRRALLPGIISVLGELLITAGAILLLFVAWQLWWTNVESDAKQSQVIKEFAQDLGTAAPAPSASAPARMAPFWEPLSRRMRVSRRVSISAMPTTF